MTVYLIVEGDRDPGDEDSPVLRPGVHPHVHGRIRETLLEGPELCVCREFLQQSDQTLLVHIWRGFNVLGSDGDPIRGIGSEACNRPVRTIRELLRIRPPGRRSLL